MLALLFIILLLIIESYYLTLVAIYFRAVATVEKRTSVILFDSAFCSAILIQVALPFILLNRECDFFFGFPFSPLVVSGITN